MRKVRLTVALTAVLMLTLLITPPASAQMSVTRFKAIDARLQQIKAAYGKLAPTQQKALDGYSNLLQFADVWHKYGIHTTEPSFAARFHNILGGAQSLQIGSSGLPPGLAPVSKPGPDVLYSSFAGFTQSETSTARCGNNVVVGFNDSGSVFETPLFFTGFGGQSFSGVAVSADGGATFTDLGPVPPGSTDFNFLGGDPGVTCSDPSTFYYSQIFDTSDSLGNPLAAISVNKSTDGGQTWGDPVAAVAKDGFTHMLDKPWSTIDPTTPGRIYVSYTDFDFTFSSVACGPNTRTAIEFVESDDGGITWGAPNVVRQVCGNAAVQGSQLAVDSHGVLHIAWVDLGLNFPFPPRNIQTNTFTPGTGFTAPVVVSQVVPGGDSFFLEGEFRDFLSMALAVDRSGSASDGSLYIAWDDGRDKIVPDDFGSTDGSYAYDDILLAQSFDGGKTWSAPVKVNTDNQPGTGRTGHDHYQPGISVDNRGFLGVCWYDRRDDNEDFSIKHFCGESTDKGFLWTNTTVPVQPFAPTHGIDLFINSVYMGDYDVVTSDFTGANSGFIGSFQVQGPRGNPDIAAYSFQ